MLPDTDRLPHVARLDGLPPDVLERAREDLRKLATWRMPFGRYQGRPVLELPEEYLLWFKQKGFPAGELGRILRLVLEIRTEGLENLCRR